MKLSHGISRGAAARVVLLFTVLPAAVLAQKPIPDPDEYIEYDHYPQYAMDDFIERLAYPDSARAAGIEGRVVVRVLVDEHGKPGRPQVVESDHTVFNEPAVAAVLATQFTPAILRQEPVPCWVVVPILFKLD